MRTVFCCTLASVALAFQPQVPHQHHRRAYRSAVELRAKPNTDAVGRSAFHVAAASALAATAVLTLAPVNPTLLSDSYQRVPLMVAPAWADDDTMVGEAPAPAPAPAPPAARARANDDDDGDAEARVKSGLSALGKATTKTQVMSSMETIADATGVTKESYSSEDSPLTPEFKKQTAVKLSQLRQQGQRSLAWTDTDEDKGVTEAYGVLKRVFDPLHAVELGPYLSIAPLVGGGVYLVLLAIQRFLPDIFNYAYVVGAAAVFLPMVVIYFSAA